MTRPLIWAIGTAAVVVGTAALSGGRLAERFGPGSAPSAATGHAPLGAAVTLSGDLRGHFTVHPAIDGKRVRMVVDTGASVVALSEEDAAMVGIKVSKQDFTRSIATANGVVAVAAVRLKEVRIGEIAVRDVEAVIVPRGKLGTSLLGMTFLKRLKGFEVSNGRLTLRG